MAPLERALKIERTQISNAYVEGIAELRKEEICVLCSALGLFRIRAGCSRTLFSKSDDFLCHAYRALQLTRALQILHAYSLCKNKGPFCVIFCLASKCLRLTSTNFV